MKDFPCKPPWTSYLACQSLLSTQVSQWATVIYCPNSAVLCQRLWLKSLTLQLLRISIFSPLFFFTFSNVVLRAHCYLPDTGAVPQGSIFSPLSQRVASLMLGLKNLEELHLGYLPCLLRAIYSGEESFLHGSNWHLGITFLFHFCPSWDKRRNNSYLFEPGHKPSNLGSMHKNIQNLLKGSQVFWKE